MQFISKTLFYSFYVFILVGLTGCTQHKPESSYIYSVNGKIPVDQLGFSLTHEHVVSIFGADISYDPKYDQNEVFAQALPYLEKIKSLGVNTIFDCTAAYFGRDVKTLKILADSSGMQFITNTGIYGSGNDRYVPNYAYVESPQQLAERWIAEFENGIDGTEIRPGFVKVAYDKGEPSDIDLKLFEAAAITHKETGLTLVTHTGDNPRAVAESLAILAKYNIHPSAWVWTHAHSVDNPDTLLTVARLGGWISLDGVRLRKNRKDSLVNVEKHLVFLEAFKKENMLHKVLLSHDGNTYPNGGLIRPYEEIMLYLIPEMKKTGFTQAEIDLLMIKNPQKAFAIRPRIVNQQ